MVIVVIIVVIFIIFRKKIFGFREKLGGKNDDDITIPLDKEIIDKIK